MVGGRFAMCVALTVILVAASGVASMAVEHTTATAGGEVKLTASDAAADELFGASVAIDGDTALVGAASVHGGRGGDAVYVFTRSGDMWVEQQKLTASDTDHHGFGAAIALQEDTAVVGARFTGEHRVPGRPTCSPGAGTPGPSNSA